jgi:hypothetical protein
MIEGLNMGTITWSYQGNEISEKHVKELAEREFDNFINYIDEIDLGLDCVVKYIQDEDDYYLSGSIDADTLKEVKSKIDSLWSDLKDKVKEQTKIELSLFYPTSEVEYGDTRVFWVIDNAYIKNPDIDLRASNNFEVVMFG